VGLLNSTPLRCQPEWRRREWLFCNIYSTFTKGMTSDSRRSHTKLTGYFCLDRAGLVGRRRNPSRRFFEAYLRCIQYDHLLSFNEIGLHTLHRPTWLRSPIAIRYPRGRGVLPDWQTKNWYEKLKSVVHLLKTRN
jgi:1-deoxy-D-xylulose-5-phosphate synthase